MKNKLQIVFIILIILVFSVIPFVYGASNQYVDLSYEEIKENEEINVKISVNKLDIGLLGLQGTLKFDPENYELIDAKINDENWMLTAFNKENGKFLAEITDEAFLDKSQHLYEKDDFIVFTLKKMKNVNKSNIELTDIKMVNSNYETIEVENLMIKEKSSVNIVVIMILIVVIVLLLTIILKNKKNTK